MGRFTLPRDIYHGLNCIEELKNLKGSKAFVVVGGGSMKRQGYLQKVENYLKEAGMDALTHHKWRNFSTVLTLVQR